MDPEDVSAKLGDLGELDRLLAKEGEMLTEDEQNRPEQAMIRGLRRAGRREFSDMDSARMWCCVAACETASQDGEEV